VAGREHRTLHPAKPNHPAHELLRDDAYQQAAIEELERRAFSVKAVHPMKDKRARLCVATRYSRNDTDKFPGRVASSCSPSYSGFGLEKYDDAVDALVNLIVGLVGEGISPQEVHYV
jgi:hypothetical protein